MDNSPNTSFWVALLEVTDEERRKRLWNGYLGQHLPEEILAEPDNRSWPTTWVEPPTDGWPQLTDEDTQFLDRLASEHGGYPVFTHHDYMDFRKHTFRETVDFSDLTLVEAYFDEAVFMGDVNFGRARFFSQAWFTRARFKQAARFGDTRFVAPVYFKDAEFRSWAQFVRVHFEGGAAFANVVFQGKTEFDESVFSEHCFSGEFSTLRLGPDEAVVLRHDGGYFSISTLCLVDFKGAKFMSTSSFKEVQFGTTSARHRIEPQRRVDFGGAVFCGATDFRKAVFVGPPGFFETKLHRDTDFHGATWLESREPYTSYNIRAWEQLELMMSELEKPQDRHRFYRLRMRALRGQRGGGLFAALSRLFELVADYGWGVRRAFSSWLIHWAVSGFILFISVAPTLRDEDRARFFLAALATSFSNAHTFLGLTSENGYLATYRRLIEEHAERTAEVLVVIQQLVGTGQAVLGPILLFLLLLTLRNRFRLA